MRFGSVRIRKRQSHVFYREAVALTGLIRFVGERVGELIHNSLAGEKFHSMFAPGFGPTPFGRTDLLGRLLHGQVCGLTRAMYPPWGGLMHAELVLLEGGQGDAVWPADGDQRGWLYDLHDVVALAAEEGRDLVTLYL